MAKPNFKNRTLYHGDNLDFLRGMNSETVHLIATDPPFNKARDFHATPDSLAAGAKFQDRWSWKRDVHEEWVDEIRDDHPGMWAVIVAARAAYGDDMAAFLCFMGVRLIEMHRVLRHDGSIYLHCDPTASHYLKALMDSIFKKKNFRNELVWWYSWGMHTSKHWNRKHDIILHYAKDHKQVFFDGNRVRIPYREGSKISTDLRYNKSYKSEGKLPEDVLDIPTINGMSKERTGYPTQKPLALYEKFVKASSNLGSFVLDPFCGCATTPVAAERLGRKWVGIDLWDKAHAVVLDRLGHEILDTPKRKLLLARGAVTYSKEPPARTDTGRVSAPRLKVVTRRKPEARQSRVAMFAALIKEHGCVCAGCDREFDDELYLELDHIRPRADGGSNDLDNRTLLCGPCNRIKSNTLTLSGLRRENKKRHRMAK